MSIFVNPNAKKHVNTKRQTDLKDVQRSSGLSNLLSFSSFEILGESIVPEDDNVPVVLQGTFLQATNLDTAKERDIFIGYGATTPFVFTGANNIILDANYISDIDGTQTVTDFTTDFEVSPTINLTVPPLQTVIVGVEYLFKPPTPQSSATQVGAVAESLGNRGYILILPIGSASFLVTVTVRQTFVKSFTDPKTIISSCAYAVPVSGGPILTGQSGTEAYFR